MQVRAFERYIPLGLFFFFYYYLFVYYLHICLIPVHSAKLHEITNKTGLSVYYLVFLNMGLDARKSVFGVSDKTSFKPVSSATPTS